MTKKILILDTGKEWGGGTNSLLEFLKRADRRRFSFTALFCDDLKKGQDSCVSKELRKIGIETMFLPRRKKGLCLRIAKEAGRALLFASAELKRRFIFRMDLIARIRPDAQWIASVIRDGGFDLLYMNNLPSTNLEGILAAKEAGIECVQHSRRALMISGYEARAVNESVAKVICVSKGVMDCHLKSGVNSEKCVVVYNGIDASSSPSIPPEEVRRRLGVDEGALVIGTVCSLVKRKRVSMLLEAVAALKDRGDIRAVIVGEGPDAGALKRKAQALGISGRVVFTGFSSDALSYINAFDIFVLPSGNEGLPRVILEAMLMGKPVAAFDIIGPDELVEDSRTGFLAPDGDLGALAEKISLLAASPEIRREFGARARDRVLKNFSIESYVKGVEEVLG